MRTAPGWTLAFNPKLQAFRSLRSQPWAPNMGRNSLPGCRTLAINLVSGVYIHIHIYIYIFIFYVHTYARTPGCGAHARGP